MTRGARHNLIFWLLSILGNAYAGEVRIAEDAWKYELRDDAGVAITELVNGKPVPVKRATAEECKAAIEAQYLKDTRDAVTYRCNLTVRATATAECEPKPQGAIEGTLDAQGEGEDLTFTIVGELQTSACTDDSRWDIREVRWVAKPFREEPAKMCWKKVETPLATCDGALPIAFREPEAVPADEPGINPPGANVIDPATGLGTDPAISGCGPDDRQCGYVPPAPAPLGQT